MRTHKGLTENVTYAILVVLMIGTLATVAIDQVIGVGELIRRETVQLSADRVESSIKSLEGVDEAKIELELGGKNGYKVYSEDGENFLNYKYLNNEKTVKIDGLDSISYTISRDEDSDRVNKICIIKKNNIEVKGGVC